MADTDVCQGTNWEEKNKSQAGKLVTNVKQNLEYFVKNSEISHVVYTLLFVNNFPSLRHSKSAIENVQIDF